MYLAYMTSPSSSTDFLRPQTCLLSSVLRLVEVIFYERCHVSPSVTDGFLFQTQSRSLLRMYLHVSYYYNFVVSVETKDQIQIQLLKSYKGMTKMDTTQGYPSQRYSRYGTIPFPIPPIPQICVLLEMQLKICQNHIQYIKCFWQSHSTVCEVKK